jgi:hypothetical protein
MRKCSLTLCLLILTVMVNGTASAEQSKPAAPDAAAAAPAESETKAKFHEAKAEVVSVDGEKKTITLKTAAGESTAPVDEKAQANLTDLKPGQKVTDTWCSRSPCGSLMMVTSGCSRWVAARSADETTAIRERARRSMGHRIVPDYSRVPPRRGRS